MACYKGSTFTFDFAASSIDVNDYTVTETLASGAKVISNPISVQILGAQTKITFNSDKIYNDSTFNSQVSSQISIKLDDVLTGISANDYKYDYSQLGETWSAPRIFRMPLNSTGILEEDKYVAVMGGGYDSSKLFIINLEDGTIAGSKVNKGPISIIDIDGNEISNGLVNAPVVITPDTAPGIPWRGAMVYVNDLEGKITKINLTNSTKNNAELYEKTTLFKLNSTKDNGRYSYFTLDATIGEDTNEFWLFGGTGNFLRVNESEGPMDNILYGFKDYDYPYFKSDHKIPRQDSIGWQTEAIQNINIANHVDDAVVCSDTTSDDQGVFCPTSSQRGWVVHLDDLADNKYRKLTGTPTVFKGRVYFPMYTPPDSSNKCSLGKAYICSEDDECGTNISSEIAIAEGTTLAANESCYFVREGILSELVIFGSTLYGNVAGPSDTQDTLVSIFGGGGDSGSRSKSWRQQSF
jgi:type IV pilus assembly protein PilY1